MTNTRIKVLSAIGFFLIGAFFYTQFQKSQIKQATATVAKLSTTQTLINNSGTITKVIANDNQLQFSQQKDGILFFGALTATNGSRTVNYQLLGQLNAKGNEVISLTLGNLTKGDQ